MALLVLMIWHTQPVLSQMHGKLPLAIGQQIYLYGHCLETILALFKNKGAQ